ncbi:unnamed protein product [Somion occarium]|uniref:Uncharacterized protein n=1 Tax=Somion occarium TaxID=3059160 RepID=A0ABP1DW95_9APHY
MPFNFSGTLVPLHLLVNPRLVVPSIIIKDIRQLEFRELRKAGYKGAVFDKDNCLTLPHRDQLVPELQDAWEECRVTFGEGNVLIVSNTAGTRLDPGEIQAESVTHHLRVPVLRHKNLKPSYACISSIRNYFSSLPTPVKDDELVIIGDRIFTDVVLANRMSRKMKAQSGAKDTEKTAEENVTKSSRAGPLSIWTSGVWEREATGLRLLEKTVMECVKRWIAQSNGVATRGDLSRFVKELPPPPVVEKKGLLGRWQRISEFWTTIRRD